jgi:hypothetical protein
MGKLMAREKQFMAAMLSDKSFRFAVSSDADLPVFKSLQSSQWMATAK